MSKGDVEHSSACSDEEEKERILEFLEFHDMKSSRALEAITETLIPSDHAVASELLARLNLVTQVGVMPSFSDAGARTGYLLKRMIHRSSILAALFLKRETSVMISAKMEQDVCRVISLGGAGGSDAMAMYLLRDYLKSKMILDVMVSDYEPGWKSAVDRLVPSLSVAGVKQNESDRVVFATCDVCQGLDEVANREVKQFCRQKVDIIVFSYVETRIK
mmetsp:Transcript_46555/g.145972  ORF Transcript_46555/g.145972 Transcript_46555/m.145972 type:complete len:218 (+) Transcript_46555:254-907(+)